MKKKCTKCKRTKNLSCFYNSSSSPDGKKGTCKLCCSRMEKSWRDRNRERINKNNREWRKKNKEQHNRNVRSSYLKRRYGLSLEEYESMLSSQGNSCAVCSGQSQYEMFDVDHCHETGKVRGLLCRKCNTALGLFRDSVDVLQRAIDYLGDN